MKNEHGTIKSYVIGFLLSVVFTLIPYYMVVNHSISGSVLLSTILGFAVLQMIIQVLFFLHLGRGPKPFYNVVFFVATVGIILVVVAGSLFIINNLHYNMTPAEAAKNLAQKEGIYQVEGIKTGACKAPLVNHQVVISENEVNPPYTQARICDTLTFITHDSILHKITFGTHPNHGSYSGEDELPVREGKNNTITLNQAGTYKFHDHLNPVLVGGFTVLP